MQRLAAAAAAAVLILALAASAEARTRPCSPPGARTMAHNGELRVYERAGHVVACDLESGRRMWLGRGQSPDDEFADYVRRVKLGGRFVAVVWSSQRGRGYYGGADRIALADFARRRFVDLRIYGCEFLSSEGGATIRNVVVAPRGRMAWLCESGPDAEGWSTFELRGFGASGLALLDTSRVRARPEVLEGSMLAWPWLEQPGSATPTVRWIHGGEVRAARLR